MRTSHNCRTVLSSTAPINLSQREKFTYEVGKIHIQSVKKSYTVGSSMSRLRNHERAPLMCGAICKTVIASKPKTWCGFRIETEGATLQWSYLFQSILQHPYTYLYVRNYTYFYQIHRVIGLSIPSGAEILRKTVGKQRQDFALTQLVLSQVVQAEDPIRSVLRYGAVALHSGECRHEQGVQKASRVIFVPGPGTGAQGFPEFR